MTTVLLCCLLIIPSRMTIDEANSLIIDCLEQQTGSRDVPRQKSMSALDWPDAERLVRVEQDDVPILASPDYAAPTLELIGVASRGEFFAVVDDKLVRTRLHLLSGAPDQSGLWYKVRLLEGNEGWILAQPRGRQGKPIATSFPVGDDQHAGPEMARDLAPDRSERNAAQYVLDRFARLIRSAFWTLVFAAGIAGVLGGAWMTRSFWRDRVRRQLSFRRT